MKLPEFAGGTIKYCYTALILSYIRIMFQHTALSYHILDFNIAVFLDLVSCSDIVYTMHHISCHSLFTNG